jgi:hypothetical protein
MHQDFSIAIGLKAMAFLDQLLAEFAIVVDLSIHHCPDSASLVSNRLMAAGRINHAQSSHSKGHPYIVMGTFLVWPSMDKPIEHPVNESRIVIPYEAANTTHEMATPNERTTDFSLSRLALVAHTPPAPSGGEARSLEGARRPAHTGYVWQIPPK